MDFKLNKSNLYLLNAVVYNPNEAGSFIWAYFLRKHNYPDVLGVILAQGGSIISKQLRFDEPHDRVARYAGIKHGYQRQGKLWLFGLKHGDLDRL